MMSHYTWFVLKKEYCNLDSLKLRKSNEHGDASVLNSQLARLGTPAGLGVINPRQGYYSSEGEFFLFISNQVQALLAMIVAGIVV